MREGPAGDQGDGAFSTGRGGAANIGSPGQEPVTTMKGDHDVVPETALRESGEGEYHTGVSVFPVPRVWGDVAGVR